jgi:mannose-6-phosphate isomerase-like protein (cupin superfamily)
VLVAEYTTVEGGDLQRLAHTGELEGERYGAAVSFILVDMPPGAGVRLHRHPYEEIFIVQGGQASYTIGSSTLAVTAPRVVIVPAGVPHAFVNSGDDPLRQVDIHASPRFITEWLEPDRGGAGG